MTRSTAARRIDALIWVFVFGGLMTLVLGLSVERFHAFWGWLVVALGAGLALTGFVLWIVRTRIPDDDGDPSRS